MPSSPASPRLRFLVGPTAVGKTALALAVAERLGAEILSCDAFCVYRGLDLGTAKPTPAEQARVPHHGLDLVDPSAPYSVEAYAAYARGVIDALSARGRPVLIVGGSGFYLKSFFMAVADGIHVSAEIRAQVAALEADGGLPALQGALRACAAAGDDTGTFDWDNPRRVARALERCLASGRSLAEVRAAHAALPDPYAGADRVVCLLERPSAELHARIAQRVDAMLAAGLVEEVAQLRPRGLEANPTAEAAIGYRETLQYLRGELPDRAALREAIVVHTRQLARKQRTWFRRQIPVDRVIPAATATPERAFPGDF